MTYLVNPFNSFGDTTANEGALLSEDSFEGENIGAGGIELPDHRPVLWDGSGVVSADWSCISESSLSMHNSQAFAGAFLSETDNELVMDGAAVWASALQSIGEGSMTGSFFGNEWFESNGAQFDGTNDHLKKTPEFSGTVTSDTGILSFWYLATSFTATDGTVVLETGNKGNIRHLANRRLRLQFPMFTMDVNADATVGVWYHILASWGPLGLHLYRNDLDVKSVVTPHTGASFNWGTIVEWKIGWLGSTNTLKFNGALADFWFAPGQYLDFSIESNRRRFISANGNPIEMGPNGSFPTGQAPMIFLYLGSGGANTFATNRGSGGNMTVIGSLDVAATTPSGGS